MGLSFFVDGIGPVCFALLLTDGVISAPIYFTKVFHAVRIGINKAASGQPDPLFKPQPRPGRTPHAPGIIKECLFVLRFQLLFVVLFQNAEFALSKLCFRFDGILGAHAVQGIELVFAFHI